MSRKWLWVALAGGGAAAAAIAFGGHSSGQAAVQTPAPYILPPITPTLGVPIVVVVTPHP